MLEQCLYDTGVKPHNAVIVGDTTFDMEMGRNAGLHTVGVRWGYHAEADLAPHTDILIDDFAALDGALNQLLGLDI